MNKTEIRKAVKAWWVNYGQQPRFFPRQRRVYFVVSDTEVAVAHLAAYAPVIRKIECVPTSHLVDCRHLESAVNGHYTQWVSAWLREKTATDSIESYVFWFRDGEASAMARLKSGDDGYQMEVALSPYVVDLTKECAPV